MTKRQIAEIEYQQILLSRYTIAQHRKEDQLDRSVYLVMSRIDWQGPMSIPELSSAFCLDASTLQRQTTSAVRDGLLERMLDPEGSVARKLALTELGRRRLAETRDHSLEALDRIMAEWSTEDVNTLAQLLRRLNTSIRERSTALAD